MTMREVKQRYCLDEKTLAVYKRTGIISDVRDIPGAGVPDCSEEECRWIGFARWMNLAGVPLETLAAYRKVLSQGDEALEVQKRMISEQREWLEEKITSMQQTLERLDCWMEQYEDM